MGLGASSSAPGSFFIEKSHMKPRYVFALVSLHSDNSDFSGNIYPEVGRIESPNYKGDKDIRHGICGVVGSLDTAWVLNTENCKVVQIDNNDEIVDVDKDHDFVKFHSGLIVHSGNLSSCGRYLDAELSPENPEMDL